MINEIYENKYASRKNEPLAQTINRHYKLPDEVKNPQFSYGQKIPGNDVTTSEILFPQDLPFRE